MPDTYELLGIAFLGVGRDEDAIQAFRRCAELAPEASQMRQSCAERAEQQGPDADSGSVPED
jgi:Flp pilus assembly protein TadD